MEEYRNQTAVPPNGFGEFIAAVAETANARAMALNYLNPLKLAEFVGDRAADVLHQRTGRMVGRATRALPFGSDLGLYSRGSSDVDIQIGFRSAEGLFADRAAFETDFQGCFARETPDRAALDRIIQALGASGLGLYQVTTGACGSVSFHVNFPGYPGYLALSVSPVLVNSGEIQAALRAYPRGTPWVTAELERDRGAWPEDSRLPRTPWATLPLAPRSLGPTPGRWFPRRCVSGRSTPTSGGPRSPGCGLPSREPRRLGRRVLRPGWTTSSR